MFHVELRSGLQIAREFNLSAEEVRARFLAPLSAGSEFAYEGHEWSPRKTRLTIYEAPRLRPDQLAMGRAWSNAQKLGQDVTAGFLQRPQAQSAAQAQRPAVVDQLKQRLIGRLLAGSVTLAEVLAITADLMPEHSIEAQIAVSQTVVWELLAQGRVQLAPSGK